MKDKKLLAFSLLVGTVLALFVVAHAQAPTPSYQLLTTIQVPGGGLCTGCTGGFDISWVDPGSQRLYLTDRTVIKGGGKIDVIDTQTNTFLYSIPTTKAEIGFAGLVTGLPPGANGSGPNGVLAIPQLNQLYVGDGDSTVKVIDLGAKAVVAIIPTGGKYRANELAYDPIDHIILIGNGADTPPFYVFISTDTQTVLGRIPYPDNPPNLEQPVFDPLTKRFYASIPLSSNPRIDVINPITMLVEKSYPTPCVPQGLVLTPNKHLFTSCGVVLDAFTGDIITRIPVAATADEIWYNVGDNRVYYGVTGTGYVLDAETNKFLVNLPSATGHTLAVDPNNNHIFAPVTGAGVKVFAAQ